MTAIQIFALISIIFAAAILYWVGYRGGLTDGKNEGYEEGHSDGYAMGQDGASAAYATSLKNMSDQCMRTELLLSREPQDRYTLLAIAEKLKLAADTFRAVRSESQATQALALRDKALDMAALMDRFELKGDAA
ncbi:hypothetical protein SAMN04490186_5742 [Pseudomonas grimontii]|uniref:Uncharacterized protein n=1 Tax=Pseudomonas grimontii TaxID=129847 RepID=A0A1H1II64_9PSED|nr:hypothetical protein [Pseudomonas grimontii]TWR64301.1 hypothetical protein FIV39_19125 [Pseudomonas grimontii]SDR37372.1 hypothetical protein SAMN04490186_5742 [Pseudomonas grimontii]